MKRRNRISGQWSPRLIEMLESPAYRVLSRSAHMAMSRVEIELAHHGGNDNGRLPVTTEDFIAYGIHPESVAPAIREAEALGFVRITERGRGGNAEYHKPNLFYLTFAHNRESRAAPPTHDWRKIKTLEEAKQIARAARMAKDPSAVRRGKQTARRPTKKQKADPGFRVVPTPGNRGRKCQNPDPGNRGYRVNTESGDTLYISGRGSQ
jgi:hypothetical protein